MSELKLATFGSGCFWCTEAVFKRLKGVEKVTSGYSGGNIENPTDDDIYYTNSGHAEVIQLEYDPNIINYEALLSVFWYTHDPTARVQPGTVDEGRHYRSSIFYHDDEQKSLAEQSRKGLEDQKVFSSRILTEILPIKNFYPAAEHHKDFYDINPNYGYCRVIIDPKIKKLREKFAHLLKD